MVFAPPTRSVSGRYALYRGHQAQQVPLEQRRAQCAATRARALVSQAQRG